MVLVFKCLKIDFMIEFIINNSQTHCSSYIKTSLENPGLIYFMMLILKNILSFLYQYGTFKTS